MARINLRNEINDQEIRPLKVLVISHMYLSTFDNVTFFVHDQVTELARQGCRVKVVSPVPWVPPLAKFLFTKWKKYADCPRKMVWDGIEVFYPRYLELPGGRFFSGSGKRMYEGILKTVGDLEKTAAFSFDIIYAHVALPDGYAGMRLSEKYRKPLITVVHGQDFQQTIVSGPRNRAAVAEALRGSQKIFAVSNKIKDIGINEMGLPRDKIEVIPNGIKAVDAGAPESLRQNYGRGKIILSVSNLFDFKGIDANIKALALIAKKYPDLLYLVVGDGPERPKLEKLAASLGLGGRVIFLGSLPHIDAIRYVSICDIFSLPSKNEAFGVVYLEAMAAAKPVIACRGQGIDGVIKDGVNGLLVGPGDEAELARAFDLLLSAPGVAKEMAVRGQELVLKEYSWKKITERIIGIFKETVWKKFVT